MPNIKSARKKLRQNIKRNLINHSIKRRILTTKKKIDISLKNKELLLIKENLSNFYKFIDKAVSKKVIKKNTAARQKSRLSKKIHLSISNNK